MPSTLQNYLTFNLIKNCFKIFKRFSLGFCAIYSSGDDNNSGTDVDVCNILFVDIYLAIYMDVLVKMGTTSSLLLRMLDGSQIIVLLTSLCQEDRQKTSYKVAMDSQPLQWWI